MAELETQDQLEAFLRTRSRQKNAAFAARAAMRVAPFLYASKTPLEERQFAKRIAPSLRAVIATSAFGFAANADVDRSHAASADASAARAAASAARAAASAASAAAYASYAAYVASASALAGSYAARAASASVLAASYAAAASAADAALLKDGVGAAALLGRPLWPDGAVPDEIAERWRELRAALVARTDEKWRPWIDWYEDRLVGKPLDAVLHREIALIPNETWEAGPAVANAEIARLVEENGGWDGGRKRPPPIPEQEPAPVVAVVVNGKIDRQPQPGSDLPDDMARIHRLLRRDANWLRDRCPENASDLREMIAPVHAALDLEADRLDQMEVGYWTGALQGLAAKADDVLIDEISPRFKNFAHNYALFAQRLEEWRGHIEQAQLDAPSAPSPQQDDAARKLVGAISRHPELFAENLAIFLEKMRFALTQTHGHSPETVYGFYKSIENVTIVLLQVATDNWPSEVVDDFADDTRKSLKKAAYEFVRENASTIMVMTGTTLVSVVRYIVG